MGASHFLKHWLGNVRTETAFHVLAYRFKHMIALIGLRGLLPGFPACKEAFGSHCRPMNA